MDEPVISIDITKRSTAGTIAVAVFDGHFTLAREFQTYDKDEEKQAIEDARAWIAERHGAKKAQSAKIVRPRIDSMRM